MPRMGGFSPALHASTHQDGGADEISIEGLAGAPAQKAAASGLASLNASSKVVQQPASISDFLETTPTNGETGKAADSNWSYDHSVDYGLHSKVVRKSADESLKNSTTLQNDDELLFAVAANEVWEFLLDLRLIRDSGSSQNMKIAFAVPSGATLVYTNSWGGPESESDGTAALALGIATSVKRYRSRYLYVGGAAAGNVQLQWAQSVSEDYNHTVKANSFIVAHKLG